MSRREARAAGHLVHPESAAGTTDQYDSYRPDSFEDFAEHSIDELSEPGDVGFASYQPAGAPQLPSQSPPRDITPDVSTNPAELAHMSQHSGGQLPPPGNEHPYSGRGGQLDGPADTPATDAAFAPMEPPGGTGLAGIPATGAMNIAGVASQPAEPAEPVMPHQPGMVPVQQAPAEPEHHQPAPAPRQAPPAAPAANPVTEGGWQPKSVPPPPAAAAAPPAPAPAPAPMPATPPAPAPMPPAAPTMHQPPAPQPMPQPAPVQPPPSMPQPNAPLAHTVGETTIAPASGPMMPATAAQPQASVVAAPVQQVTQPAEPEHMRGAKEADALNIHQLMKTMVDMGASDLHLTVGVPPMVRVHGGLVPMEGTEVLDTLLVKKVVTAMMAQKQREEFEERWELDFSYNLPGTGRFRVNVFRQQDNVGAVLRLIPYEIKTVEDLGLPETVADFAQYQRGLVLVTGTTGSGKSTTLAAIIDRANRTRNDHILTVEDPVEFVHEHKKCVVNQRQVGDDTKNFASALRQALRQDPDIILVGEIRDVETTSVALTAAETGHLVLGTLHTQDAVQTIDRIIDVYPAEQQDQVRTMLASAVQAVLCQTLVPNTAGNGRVPIFEIMIATPGIRNLIREGKTHQVYTSMQSGKAHGMITMDQCLANAVKEGRIAMETGLEVCHNEEEYKRLMSRL